MTPIGLAVIGAGYWGPNLVRSALATPQLRLEWLCDLDVARARQVLGAQSTVRATASFEDVLADPNVNAVAIATPAATHFDLVRAALEAGKHVLVEKPLTPTVDEGRKLAELARRGGLALMCDHTNDFPFFAASYAAQRLGAYSVPVNWHGKAPEIGYVPFGSIGRSRPRLLDRPGACAYRRGLARPDGSSGQRRGIHNPAPGV